VDSNRRAQVVVVGAGFGGLEAATGLAEAPADVTILDRQNHHCFQPLLYQVATAQLSPAEVAWPVRAILRRQRNARVLLAEVDRVDTTSRVVHAAGHAIAYDYLILATGVTHAYFGHDEWAAVAPGLKRIEDATEIRRRFLLAFERAELSEDDAERARLLTFVIIGGGPTGVEMAGAMAEVARQTLQSDFRRIDPRASRIVLIEAGPRILPTFPERLSAYAQSALERMGVEVLLGSPVTHCDRGGVALGERRIDAATLMWAAGVAASPAASWIGAETDRAGRVKVLPDLSVAGSPEIFAIGDLAAVEAAPGRPVPGIAPAAKQMGRHVAGVIAARLRGESAPAPFVYRHNGDLATVGRKSAIVVLDRVVLTGFLGWLFWGLVHIYFLIGVRERFIVAVNWLWSYVTFQRGARLITNPPRSTSP
jgi:NADH dehydrogenase